ncbi:MAG TPA: thiamine phosphate synthase [Pyrinomonadaceae bacterium]|nr:thiamine phosphate synthase [Pyrinomonadaceae bacterium]
MFPQLPIIYPITSGTTTAQTPANDPQFSSILRMVEAAVAAKVPLLQIREKALHARVLFELVVRAVEIVRGSETRLLVNDRSDIARAGGADGVHLTSQSLPADVVRRIYGPEFLIGVSTHSVEEARMARIKGADFVVFGPVFETESKRAFGPPQGLEKLREVCSELGEFPVIAIGGITLHNAKACLSAGASGIAGISLFNE